MKHLQWIGTGCVAAVLLMAGGKAWSAPQDPAKPAYTRPEYDEYLAAHLENNSANKIKLLDSFVGKYPMSTLLAAAYTDYYSSYAAQKNYLKTIEWVDKLLALGDKAEQGLRLQALSTRAVAYLADCGDGALQNPEAYTAAREAAKQGWQALDQWRMPPNMTLGEFAAQKDRLGMKFDAVTQIAEAGLKGQKSDLCQGAAVVPDSTVRDPDKFGALIKQLDNEQRQSPPVR